MTWRKGYRVNRLREHEATGIVHEIYEETKEKLGLPYVDFVFQAFGMYPAFLELHWRAFRPIVESVRFFERADRLRADAYTRVHSYFRIQNLCEQISSLNLSSTEQEEITRVIELCQYGRTLLLLILAAQFQAFETEIGEAAAKSAAAAHPVFSHAPMLVEEHSAPPQTRRVFEELKENLQMPFVPGEYRALARWPEFLKIYWQAVKTATESPVYEGCHHALLESAFSLARELPGPIQLTISDLSEAGISDDDMTSIVRITELFVHSLSVSVLNIAVAKIGMEGGNEIRRQEQAKSQRERAA